MLYKIGIGHDIVEAALVPIAPQPRSPGVQAIRRTYSATNFFQEGLYVELRWTSLGRSANYRPLLAQFGLDTTPIAPVTILAPDRFYEPQIYNGEAIRPENIRDRNRNIFVRDVLILVRNLWINEY
jgi:hypothetical protein